MKLAVRSVVPPARGGATSVSKPLRPGDEVVLHAADHAGPDGISVRVVATKSNGKVYATVSQPLPAELRRELSLEKGDALEFESSAAGAAE